MNLITAIETAPYTYEIIAQVIAKMKNEFLECGCGIPVFLFHGTRANGKTSTIKACMENTDNVVKFSEGYKDIKKKTSKMKPNEVLLVDNYPQYISSASHQQGKRILEYIVDQGSENPDFPLVVISAENYIYDDLVDSIKTRMLEVDVPKIEADPLLNEIRQYLIGNRGNYLNLIQKFVDWYKCDKDKMKLELKIFRSKHSQYEYRTVGIAFSYYYACKLFSYFMHSSFGEKLEMRVIEKNCEKLFSNKNPEKEVSVVVSILNNIIEDNGIFHVTEPTLDCYCNHFLNSSCPNAHSKCNHNDNCSECVLDDIRDEDGYSICKCNFPSNKKSSDDYYNPMHLRLSTEANAAVLIGHPTKIYQFPDYLNYDSPILIVSGDDLLRIMNIELNSYCIENNLAFSSYGPKQLNKELFTNNLCLYHYHNKNHKTYTFEYYNTEGQKKHVVLLKISKNQYNLLHNRAKETDRCKRFYIENSLNQFDIHQYGSFVRALKQIGNTVHTLYKK